MITIDREAAKKRVDDAELVPIFELANDEGDMITYSIPKVARAELTLNYLDVVSTKGEEAAAAYMIIEMFGQEAFDSLRSVEGLSDEELDQVTSAVLKIVAPKSNPKGRRG